MAFQRHSNVGLRKEGTARAAEIVDRLCRDCSKERLKSGQTGPKTLLELRQLPVGKSSAIDANRTLLSMLFQGHDLEMYQPIKTVDIDGNRFVVMKISDTPGKVPTLAEVKDEVVKAWKKQQAAELAKNMPTSSPRRPKKPRRR